jgi:hypothetical protein
MVREDLIFSVTLFLLILLTLLETYPFWHGRGSRHGEKSA